MKKLYALWIVFLSVAFLLAGCSSDPVEEDVNNYLKNELPKMSALEQDILTQFAAISGNRELDAESLHKELNDKVLSKYETFVQELEKIKPATEEVQQAHEKHVTAARAQLEAFKAVVSAIKNKDQAELTAAREKLEAAKKWGDESKEAIKQLAIGYGVQ